MLLTLVGFGVIVPIVSFEEEVILPTGNSKGEVDSRRYEHDAEGKQRQELKCRSCGDDAVPSLLENPRVQRSLPTKGRGREPDIDGCADP